jgi:hypothetical protein
VAATGKWVGGVDYAYAVAGDANKAPAPAAQQRAALAAMLKTLSPAELTVPDALVGWLSSGVNGRNDAQFDTEVFDNAGAAAFDPLAATDAAAQITLDSLLAPTRLTRVHLQHARDAGQLGLGEMLDALGAATWDHSATAVERRIAMRALLSVAAPGATPQPRWTWQPCSGKAGWRRRQAGWPWRRGRRLGPHHGRAAEGRPGAGGGNRQDGPPCPRHPARHADRRRNRLVRQLKQKQARGEAQNPRRAPCHQASAQTG